MNLQTWTDSLDLQKLYKHTNTVHTIYKDDSEWKWDLTQNTKKGLQKTHCCLGAAFCKAQTTLGVQWKANEKRVNVIRFSNCKKNYIE